MKWKENVVKILMNYIYEHCGSLTHTYGAPHMTCKKKIINCVHDLLKHAHDYYFVPSIC